MTLENAELAEEKSILALNYSSAIRESNGDCSPSAVRQTGNPFVEKRREARYKTHARPSELISSTGTTTAPTRHPTRRIQKRIAG